MRRGGGVKREVGENGSGWGKWKRGRGAAGRAGRAGYGILKKWAKGGEREVRRVSREGGFVVDAPRKKYGISA